MSKGITASNIKLKRAYDRPGAEDGTRILIDRLWPRGLTKEKASVDLWLKDIAPSTELRKWFGHDPSKWEEFKKLYFRELMENSEPIQTLKLELKRGKVTLLYGAKDEVHNEARAILESITLFI